MRESGVGNRESEIGKEWGDGEMRRWGDGEMGNTGWILDKSPQSPSGSPCLFPTPYSLLPTPYSLLPTPCSLFPVPCSLCYREVKNNTLPT
ncbi:hypothetical protein [Moorena sp. SIO3H5]|uniref:hypothetical protein n=1 Tax=Moorena sp. SIO3H5 TaxID=2607834 RepID=UPI0013B935AA|nr:hypothetical protein [Moorena sp. SIO3H5]NEO73777.1 hypothetical protein [Moorena sp. SIO3H5]